MIIRPFDLDDLIKIDSDKGIVRTIGLTKIVMETFDSVLIEKSNAQIISSKVVNYTIKLGKKKNLADFKKKILSPQDTGLLDIGDEYFTTHELMDEELNQAYNFYSTKNYPNLYNFTFNMTFPFKRFQKNINQVEELCRSYQEKAIFRIRPKYDIVNFDQNIKVKFRILTFKAEKIFDYQPQFASDIFQIISNNCVEC